MQHRTSDQDKIDIVTRYLSNEKVSKLSSDYLISTVAIRGLLKRRNIKIRQDQLTTARKYPIDETFFDSIDTEEKAYFLGFLYADGYNNTERNSVSLNLHKKDKEILIKLNNLLQPQKPLQFINYENKYKSRKNQFRLVIANKHISERLSELGCVKAKTFKLLFPKWIKKQLINHFVRGYFDGDGWSSGERVIIVSTKSFCKSLSKIIKDKLKINTYVRARHPERKHNIRMLEINGRKQTNRFLDWIYKDATIFLKRKNKRNAKRNASKNILFKARTIANGESIPIGNFLTRRTSRL